MDPIISMLEPARRGCSWELCYHLQMIVNSLVHLLRALEPLPPERLLCCFVTFCAIYASKGVA